jgi:protein CrcB
MAVDGNVIIFARIKEEALAGKSLALATSQGFRRAVTTVLDGQITTFIAALVLYMYGTGPVRGFALTLIIGLIIGFERNFSPLPPNLKACITGGFLGALSTFSTFSLETVQLMEGGRYGAMTLNILGNVVVSVACVLVGLQIMRTLAKCFT